jgi:hypothetical protein
MIETIKMKPFDRYESKSPRCFKGVKNLPVKYANNTSSWMTASVFEDHLCNWDRELGKKKNCTSSGQLSR